MTALTWAPVTERPAAASELRRHRFTESSSLTVVPAKSKTTSSMSMMSPFTVAQSRLGFTELACYYLLGQSKRERHTGAANTRDCRHCRCGVNDNVRFTLVLDIRAV